MYQTISDGPDATAALGLLIGAAASAGDVIGLYGGLGAGKTSLARSICSGAGIDDPRDVHSPTFTLVNEYSGRITIYHSDLYRLTGLDEALDAGLGEIFDPHGLTLVEWPDKIPDLLPGQRLDIFLEPVTDQPQSRLLKIIGRGEGGERLAAEIINRIEKA